MTTMPPVLHDTATTVRAPMGELDVAAVPELRMRLAAAHRAGAQLVLDLRDVTFLDSSALSVVLAADRRLAVTGGSLRLVHVSAEVRRVLRICGLADLVLPSPVVALHGSLGRTAQLVR
jgi:anti-sigma B factor antagonist